MIKLISLVVLVSVSALWLYDQPDVSYGSLKIPISDTATSSILYGHLTARIAVLEEKLRVEVQVRRNLELQLAELEKELTKERTIEQVTDADTCINELQGNTNTREGLMDDVLLEELGVSRSMLEQMQLRLDESRVSLVSLRDRAAREGWIDTDRYNDELIGLFDPSGSLRDEFGDDVYDGYLYAVGKPNRVQTKSVYANSEASFAGIQVGDVLLRYGSEQLFSIRDLRLASMGGTAGQPVLVELLRNGITVYVTVPQGPIGVELEAVNLKP